MKCPECHREMQRKEHSEGIYYYECPNCHHSVGKPVEVQDEEKSKK